MTAARAARSAALAWVGAACAGVTTAVLLGPFMPGWGLAAGVPVGTLVLAAGVLWQPQDAAVSIALHVALALTLGFGATTAGITLHALEQAGRGEIEVLRHLAQAGAERARGQLWPRWALMGSMVLPGAAALAHRRRHRRPG